MNFKVIDEYIGSKLKELRQERGYSLEEVASRAGIKGKVAYRSYETGRTSLPLKTFKKICNIYGVDYCSLFEEAQEQLVKQMKQDKHFVEKEYGKRKKGK